MTEPASPAPARSKRRGPPKPAIVVGLAGVVLVGWLFLRGGQDADESRFTGYVVSDNLYLSAPVAGTVAWIGAEEGQQVRAGMPLFRIDPAQRTAEVEEARAQVSASSAQTAEHRAALGRARANLAAYEAEAERLAVEARRLTGAQEEKPGSVAGLELDQARAAYRAALRRRDAARTEVAAAAAAIEAAAAQVRRSRAGVAIAEADLAELSAAAPVAARVDDIMYQPGEWAAANAPIVSLVPEGAVKVRFYVPQAVVNEYRPGTRVAVACDGCRPGMTATVSFVASRPEFTPPVIYSLEARDKLVFMVEARPSHPRMLVPGQPLDITRSGEQDDRR